MPVRILIALLVVTSVSLLAYGFLEDESSYAVAAIPVVVLLAVCVTFKPQLDWWYYRKFPSDLEPPVVKHFAAALPDWYQRRSEAEKLAFRQNLFLVRMGLDFKPQGGEGDELPVDLAAILAVPLTRILEGTGKHTLEPFENVVVYKHAFPSPAYPKQWHNSELYAEDGVILLNLDRAVPGVLNPQAHFDIAMYEWLRAAKLVGLSHEAGATPGAEWRRMLASVSSHDERWVLDAIGLEEVDGEAVVRTLVRSFG